MQRAAAAKCPDGRLQGVRQERRARLQEQTSGKHQFGARTESWMHHTTVPGVSPYRRLGRLKVHLACAAADAVPDDEKWARPQHELHSVEALPAPDVELMRKLGLGILDVSGLPFETVRSMMRPEPEQPSECEANMSGFMP